MKKIFTIDTRDIIVEDCSFCMMNDGERCTHPASKMERFEFETFITYGTDGNRDLTFPKRCPLRDHKG